MIKLNKELLNCKVPNQEKILKIKIRKTDDKINQLVYKLYDLTEDEIRIIEESIGNDSWYQKYINIQISYISIQIKRRFYSWQLQLELMKMSNNS